MTFAIPALGHNEHDVLPLIVAVALGAMAATILAGLATTWSALAARPAAFLRAEEAEE